MDQPRHGCSGLAWCWISLGPVWPNCWTCFLFWFPDTCSGVNLVGAALHEEPSAAGAGTGRRRCDNTKKPKHRQHEAGRGHEASSRCTLGSKGWLHGHVQSQPQISISLIIEWLALLSLLCFEYSLYCTVWTELKIRIYGTWKSSKWLFYHLWLSIKCDLRTGVVSVLSARSKIYVWLVWEQMR